METGLCAYVIGKRRINFMTVCLYILLLLIIDMEIAVGVSGVYIGGIIVVSAYDSLVCPVTQPNSVSDCNEIGTIGFPLTPM